MPLEGYSRVSGGRKRGEGGTSRLRGTGRGGPPPSRYARTLAANAPPMWSAATSRPPDSESTQVLPL